MINETEKSKTLEIKCGIPQGSYVNDLNHMCADDTNLFYSHQSINTVFNIANIATRKNK